MGVRKSILALLGATLILLAGAGMSGCATLSAETSGQRWYAAKSEYAIYLHLALRYAETPGADPDVVAAFARIDSQVQALVTDVDLVLQGTDQESRDKVQRSTEMLLVLTLRMREVLIENEILDGSSAALRFAP